MYGQDAYAEQIMNDPGLGYGGYLQYAIGKGPLEGFYNRTSDTTDTPLNVGAAWKLSGNLVSTTPSRLALTGNSRNGFAVLAGRSTAIDKVQVLLNNDQVDCTALAEVTAKIAAYMNTSTTAYPLFHSNGLFNGEQMCFTTGNPNAFIPLVCQSFDISHNPGFERTALLLTTV